MTATTTLGDQAQVLGGELAHAGVIVAGLHDHGQVVEQVEKQLAADPRVHPGFIEKIRKANASIVGFRTESGAEYLVENGAAGRLANGVPRYDLAGDFAANEDVEWMLLLSPVRQGAPVRLGGTDQYRVTTCVAEIYHD